MPTTHNNGVRLHWDERGTGTPLLLIMGHLYTSDMWYPVLPAFTAEHRVIWFDNRGTGRSGSTRHATASDLAADARAVLDAAGVDTAHVYGVSMGGGVAMTLAHENPERVRSLVLGCTAYKTVDLPVKTRKERLLYYVPLRLLRGVFRKSSYGPACPPEAADRDVDLLVRSKVSPRGLLGQAEAMASYAMTADKVAALAVPALVLHGDADLTVDVQRGRDLAAVLPDSRLVVYPGAGHNFVVACTEQANADVLGFLAEVDAVPA